MLFALPSQTIKTAQRHLIRTSMQRLAH